MNNDQLVTNPMSSSKPQKYVIPKYFSMKHRIFKRPHFPKVLGSRMPLGCAEILVFSFEAEHAVLHTPRPPNRKQY